MHDNYGSSGIHPNASQQAINLQFGADNINDEKSPYGAQTTPNAKIPGFTPVYSLKKTDDPIDTFGATGLEDSPVGRVSMAGLPVPEECRPKNADKDDEEAYLTWTDENLAFQGITEPATEPFDMDVARTYRVIMNGATDTIINEDVQAGDTLVWRPIGRTRREQKATKGSWLERMNPNSPDVVPLTKEYFSGNFASITASVVKGLDKSDLRRIKAQAGAPDTESLDGLIKRLQNNNPGDSEYTDMTRSRKRQIIRVLMALENAVKINEAIDKYLEISDSASPGIKNTKIDAISAAAGASALNIGSHYHDITSHKMGRAVKNGKGGFTTFMVTNTGSS